MRTEAQAVLDRYQRRRRRYDPLDPSVYQSRQEFERALIRWLNHLGLRAAGHLSLLEVGCGNGAVLQQLLRLGFEPQNLVGIELQPPLAQRARQLLPAAVRIHEGDALDIALPAEHFDVVLQSLVFSSILDDEFQRDLARHMWRLAKPGGGVLSYDFTFNNPSNPDVRSVRRERVEGLFPDAASITSWRLTLAPPLSRAVTKIHPAAYTLLNALPFLRTHLLCWIAKADQ